MSVEQLFDYFSVLVLGMLLMMFLYIFFKYLILKEKVYLHYALYIFCMFCDFVVRFSSLSSNTNFRAFDILISITSYIFYLLFTQNFLNLEANLNKIYRLFNQLIRVLFFYLGVELLIIVLQLGKSIEIYLYTIVRVLLILSCLAAIFVIKKNIKDNVVSFFTYGSMSLIIGASISMALSNPNGNWDTVTHFWKVPIIYMQFGLVIEVIFFSLGLSYKNKQTESEKAIAQESLLVQLQKNQELQGEMQTKLEWQVEKVTDELNEKNEELIAQKNIQLQFEYEGKMNQLKQRALRAQMNPHFIYNSIVTLEAFNIEDKKEAFSQFSQKFAKLTRAILENSQYDFIPITKDMEAIRYYLTIEAIRMENKFTFSIDCEDTLATKYMIPPLLIQPYVENAILHGLRHKNTTNGFVNINIFIATDKLVVTIEDNGIGIKRSKYINETSIIRKEKQSLGQIFTSERIESLNHSLEKKYYATIEELEGKKQTGTKITLFLPLVEK